MKRVFNRSWMPLLLLFAAAACNMNRQDDVAPVSGVTDSTTTGAATAPTPDNTTVNATADSNRMATDTVGVRPNPVKKGKKGTVNVTARNSSAGDESAMDKEGYYVNVYPSYPGGDNAINKFFQQNIQYPQDASDNGVEGTVELNFTVDERGKVGSVKTVNPAIGYGLEQEAVRVFKKMPAWQPGSLKGKNVKTRYSLPVRFELAD